MVKGVIGSEWDEAGQPGCPTVQKLLSWTGLDTYGNSSEADAILYTAPSSARVFAAGTLNFSHGLDSFGRTTPASPTLQAFTLNLLNDLSGTPPTAPLNLAPPSISGTASQGSQLAAAAGTWTEAPNLALQWSRCDSTGANCVPISGATASTYTAVTADDGATLEVTVTATNSAGSASATSSDTAVVSSAPTNTTLPSISGSDSVGGVLLASPGVWTGSPAPSFAYQWSRCDSAGANCVPISGATASTYTAVTADAGSTLEVTVTATNSAGSASATSSAPRW